ncbi:MAG: hydroxypyruvate isomerase family protein [Alphaproteobacteria bacterium]|nr:hydroxypyruvate isomerase family protein [Alphaproteobacteria bacterium]MDG1887873.1 hydroxypyruvate isomerase family protein [Alphaproteobacteria bacterium]
MPKFAANISMMFNEVDFLDRFAAAAAAGFKGVEFLFPYDYSPEEIKVELDENNLIQVLFNTYPGDWERNERGLASIPGREQEFEKAVEQSIIYANILENQCIHVMSGLVEKEPSKRHFDTLISNLKRAAPVAAQNGKTLIIEPINTRDIPGYFLNYQAQARSIIEIVGADNVKLQFDLYHCQIMEGDLAIHMREYLDIIAHMQIAGTPGRHEPNIGEVNYPYLFELMDELGYEGWVGCEYRPKVDTNSGLSWMKEL